MSHFSKITTSIINEKPLKQALRDLGLFYSTESTSDTSKRIYVYKDKDILNNFVFYFDSDGSSYSLIADTALWSLDMNFELFVEKLNQHYAVHTILNQSQVSGFQEKSYNIMPDGSIKLVIQKLSNIYN